MNIEVKASKGRLTHLILHYSVFDIRHSEKHEITWLHNVTQAPCARPWSRMKNLAATGSRPYPVDNDKSMRKIERDSSEDVSTS
jgi:hypothetical protein